MSMHPRNDMSDLTLEQYLLGELSPEKESGVRAALQADESLRIRLEALRESDRQILAAYPAEDMAVAIRARLPDGRAESGGVGRRFSPLALALPAAATILLFLSFLAARERIIPQLSTSMAEVTRLKGVKTHLTVYRKADDGAEELTSGQAARQKDILQISYTAAEARHGVILSVDGRGTVTWHLPGGYPGTAAAAPALNMQGEIVLPSAYELDDAPGFERFILVYSEASFDVRAVEQAVRALAARPRSADNAALTLPAGVRQYSVVLKKQGGKP